MVVIEAEKAPAVVGSGVYSDTLRRVDGRWKFARRKLDVDPSRQATSATNMGGSAMTDKAKVPAAVSSAIIKGDWDGVRAGLADDIVYKPGSRDEIYGADNTMRTLKGFFTQVAVFTGHKVRQIWEAEGVDGVAIEMDAYYRRIKDNKDFVITCTDIYRLRGDKICEWRVNADLSPLLLD
jgi:limonene-1,2-epoxide hydrolase